MHHPTYMIVHTTTFVIPVVEHWLEREIGSMVVSGVTVCPNKIKFKTNYECGRVAKTSAQGKR